MTDLTLLQGVIDRWITMGQALVASVGALAFVLAFLWRKAARGKTPRRSL
jgi:hypothetical protein